MNTFKLQRITIKKINLLIEKEIGDKERLEQIQMKIVRGLPILSENQSYVDGLILEHLTSEEIDSIRKEIETATLEKSNYDEQQLLHCVCCGNAKKSLDNGGMCANRYLDYNIKISKFITRLTGGGPFF